MNFTCVGLELNRGAEGLLSDVKLHNNLLVIQFGQKVLYFMPSLAWISHHLPGQQPQFLQCPHRRDVWKNGFCAESNYFSRISSFWIFLSDSEREKSHPGNICSGENFIKNKYIFVYFFFIICTIFVLRKKVPNSGLSISGQHYLFWPS